jgi:phage baseplate assembly protein W
MDAGVLYGRGISFPPRLGPDGRMLWSEGPQNVRESIQVILLTETGERLHRPAFGGNLRPLLGEPNTVATRRLVQQRIEEALQRWEPRITLLNVSVEEAADDPSTALATIDYRLVATQVVEQTALRVPLGG